jgi:hypothetical protein
LPSSCDGAGRRSDGGILELLPARPAAVSIPQLRDQELVGAVGEIFAIAHVLFDEESGQALGDFLGDGRSGLV